MENYKVSSHQLDDNHTFLETRLPDELLGNEKEFEALWNLHPEVRPTIMLVGKQVQIPRYQKAYGADYHFSGQTSKAEPVPEIVIPYLTWAQATIDEQLNGVLFNWYEGKDKHYIGAHNDSTVNLVHDSSIVTISLGEERIFRLTKPKAKERRDFVASNGSVFILPWKTNLAWKHSVPHFARYHGRRISITLRAFEEND